MENRPEDKWDNYVTQALYVLRNRTNAATDQTPSKLVLGYEMPVLGQWEVPEYQRQRMFEERPPIREIQARQLDFQEKYSKPDQAPPVKFRVGDMVLARKLTGAGHAFSPAWTGPHEIVRVITDVLYEINRDGAYAQYHVDKLRPMPAEPLHIGEDTSDDESSDDDHEMDPPEDKDVTQEETERERERPEQPETTLSIPDGPRVDTQRGVNGPQSERPSVRSQPHRALSPPNLLENVSVRRQPEWPSKTPSPQGKLTYDQLEQAEPIRSGRSTASTPSPADTDSVSLGSCPASTIQSGRLTDWQPAIPLPTTTDSVSPGSCPASAIQSGRSTDWQPAPPTAYTESDPQRGPEGHQPALEPPGLTQGPLLFPRRRRRARIVIRDPPPAGPP